MRRIRRSAVIADHDTAQGTPWPPLTMLNRRCQPSATFLFRATKFTVNTKGASGLCRICMSFGAGRPVASKPKCVCDVSIYIRLDSNHIFHALARITICTLTWLCATLARVSGSMYMKNARARPCAIAGRSRTRMVVTSGTKSRRDTAYYRS